MHGALSYPFSSSLAPHAVGEAHTMEEGNNNARFDSRR